MVSTRRQIKARLIEEQKQRDSVSARKVFDIPELLEKILLDIGDMKTILLAQRVDKTFKATIDGSVALKKALWLLPDDTEKEVEVNPILRWYSLNDGSQVPSILVFGQYGPTVLLELNLDQLLAPHESWKPMTIVRTRDRNKQLKFDADIWFGYRMYNLAMHRGSSLTAGELMAESLDYVRKRNGNTFDWNGEVTLQQ